MNPFFSLSSVCDAGVVCCVCVLFFSYRFRMENFLRAIIIIVTILYLFIAIACMPRLSFNTLRWFLIFYPYFHSHNSISLPDKMDDCECIQSRHFKPNSINIWNLSDFVHCFRLKLKIIKKWKNKKTKTVFALWMILFSSWCFKWICHQKNYKAKNVIATREEI